MIEGRSFVAAALGRGFAHWTGVPCSYLDPLLAAVATAPGGRYVPAANEGEAVAIAAGVHLGGGRAAALMQNSGLGNAVNPLTSLAHAHRIPLLLLVSLRGDPSGPPDEPQHGLMGEITTDLLSLLKIAWEPFPAGEGEVAGCLERATRHMDSTGLPYALVVRKGDVGPGPSPPRAGAAPRRPPRAGEVGKTGATRRADVLREVQAAAGPRDVVLATTGYTGRELYAIGDRASQLYLVGAMGCASSVGIGLALRRPDLRVIVLDGDGAALMRLGAMATIGRESPPNLVHLVLDNGLYESTGGQETGSGGVDLAAIATACGYPEVHVAAAGGEVGQVLAEAPRRLTFVRAMIAPGVGANLPRPARGPAEVTRRFREHLRGLPEEGA